MASHNEVNKGSDSRPVFREHHEQMRMLVIMVKFKDHCRGPHRVKFRLCMVIESDLCQQHHIQNFGYWTDRAGLVRSG